MGLMGRNGKSMFISITLTFYKDYTVTHCTFLCMQGTKVTKWEKRRQHSKDKKRKAQEAELRANRKDAKKQKVIINEKRDKKVAKYLLDTVPYPFKTREQYEASIRAPIGKEWNTASSHEKMTKPAVIVKSGSIINPIRYTKGMAKEKAEADEAWLKKNNNNGGSKKRGSNKKRRPAKFV